MRMLRHWWRLPCVRVVHCKLRSPLLGVNTRSPFHRCLLRRFYSSRGIAHLEQKGLVAEIFPDDRSRLQDMLNGDIQCVYAGFDPTADSLHVGNLLVLVALLHFQRAGHDVIALIGGSTAQIGDPSGRRTERPSMEVETVEQNCSAIEDSLRRVFTNHERHLWTDRGETDPLQPLRVLNNTEWYSQYSLVDFLSIIGRRFRMSDMLSRSSVQSRLSGKEGMSFTEFTYQMFQAYDWLYLWRKYGCSIQIGGTDQRGNMVTGLDLIRGTITEQHPAQLYGLTVPLITTEEGDKLGKSAGNTIWLSAERTSPYELYQYFVRMPDSEVERLLHLFTFYSPQDVRQIMDKHWGKPDSRHAQKKLAENVTTLVHGEEGLKSAKRITNAIYSRDPEALVELDATELRNMFRHSPVAELMMTSEMTSLDLAMQAKCFARESDAIRIMAAGGFHINQRRVTSSDQLITADQHVMPNGTTLIRVGKKNYYIVKWV